jgi:hypothetical protein
MRRPVLIGLLLAAVGCGDGIPKPRELTPAEQEKLKLEEKAIEDEERGPAQPKGSKVKK